MGKDDHRKVEPRAMRSICEIGGKLPILHSSMCLVVAGIDASEPLDLGLNPAGDQPSGGVNMDAKTPGLHRTRANRTACDQHAHSHWSD